MTVLPDVVRLLLLSVVAVAVLRRFRLPAIIGYVLVGAAAGPHALGWLAETDTLVFLGEIGIAFLLFTLGLEFSVPQFVAMKRTVIVLGGLQVLGGTFAGGVIAWMLGLPLAAALIVGGALAMSSTAIAIKQLADQLELQTPHGRMAVGILLFQDLAAIPLLVVIPILAQSGAGALALSLSVAIFKGAIAVAVMLAVGRYALRPLFHEVGASGELFTLTALLVSLTAAWATYLAGLSLALGAFLAGMMLSETEYRHQVENDIRPFRDILLGLFFIATGMQIEPRVVAGAWPWVALLVAGLVFGKGALIALLTRAAGYRMPQAWQTGMVLAHAGEFSIALLALASTTGLLAVRDSQIVLAAVVMSMAIAPLLIRYTGRLVNSFVSGSTPGSPGREETELAHALGGAKDHVVICGYGRVGKQLARILGENGWSYVALDIDPIRVRRAFEAGERVHYGDATRRGILKAAGVAHARALVVSFDYLPASFRAVHEARALNGDLPILVRANDDAALDRLLEAGATEVVPEALESSLMLGTQLLLLLGTRPEDVAQGIRAIREQRYRLLRGLD